ncbi:MAG TPA: urease accessory protein UreD [Anaeromyxobacteraceae bacterium]|nr:urease accessory protein UreD [Anaeromyxobacteraceae bacterium]
MAAGAGALGVALADGASALVTCRAAAPLQLLVPRPRGAAVWACAASLGGGLVAGDRLALSAEVEAGATLLLGTQAVTKVYRSGSGAAARQALDASAGAGALLASVPDPVCCFEGARFEQRQVFRLSDGASLLAFDGLAAGRVARGERWAFSSCESRLEVWRDGRLVVSDALLLGDLPGLPLAARMGALDHLLLAVAIGPRAAGAARVLLAAAGQARPEQGVLASAGEVPGGVVARFGAPDRGPLTAILAGALAPLAPALGGDPLERKW